MDTIGFIILGGLLLVPLLQMAHTKYMQPIRVRFAKAGADLLQDSRLSDEDLKLVDKLLDDAFKWQFGLLVALFMTPILTFVYISKLIGAAGPKHDGFDRLSSFDEGEEFLDLHMQCALGSNPIALVLIMIQAVPFLLILPLFRRGLKTLMRWFEANVVGYLGSARRV